MSGSIGSRKVGEKSTGHERRYSRLRNKPRGRKRIRMDNKKLTMIVWDVKRGNAISLHLPNGRTVMVDCGASDDCSPVSELYSRYGVKTIHELIVTHPVVNDIMTGMNVFWQVFFVGEPFKAGRVVE